MKIQPTDIQAEIITMLVALTLALISVRLAG